MVRADDFESNRLSAAPRAALSHVGDLVRRQEPATSLRVRDVLRRAGCRLETYREAIECVRGHARVVVHFHPDRIGNKPTTVAEALLEEGIYRNQFETGISAGGLSAFPGGPRDTWERTLFGGAYHTEHVTDSERPKYGALEPRRDPAELETGRVLDTQIEAQVHGPIELRQDVELLVADPAFAGTDTGITLSEISQRYRFPLRWHCGFRLRVEEVPDDFRGPAMPRLARRIARADGVLDAAVIGAAETSFKRDPETWRDWGSRSDELQHLKQLWHVLVHCGRPARATDSPA